MSATHLTRLETRTKERARVSVRETPWRNEGEGRRPAEVGSRPPRLKTPGAPGAPSASLARSAGEVEREHAMIKSTRFFVFGFSVIPFWF